MVSVGVSVLGVTGLHFVNPGVKVNGKYYRETLLQEELLPFPITLSFGRTVYQQRIQLIFRLKLQLSPHLTIRLITVWSLLREQVYKVKVTNFDELRQRIQTGMNLTNVLLTR